MNKFHSSYKHIHAHMQTKVPAYIHHSTWTVILLPSGEALLLLPTVPPWQREVFPYAGVAAEGPTHGWHQRWALEEPVTAVCKLNMTNRFPASPLATSGAAAMKDGAGKEKEKGDLHKRVGFWSVRRGARGWPDRQIESPVVVFFFFLWIQK